MTPGAVLVIAVICALISMAIGSSKGRGTQGFFFGLILGVIGIIIIACLKPDREFLVRKEQEKIRIQQEAAARMGGPAGNGPGY